MKKTALPILISLAALSAAAAQAQDHRCSDSSDYAAHASNPERDGACYATPQSLTLKVHEFGLCKSASSPSDRSDCTTLFLSAAGRDMQMASGQSLSLMDQVSLEEGTYTHAYLVLNTFVKMETVLDFGTDPSNFRTDLQGRTGRYCFTNGQDYNTNPDDIVECSNSLTNLAEASETVGLGDDNGYSNTMLGYQVSIGGVTVDMDLYMLDNSGDLSTNDNDDFAIYASQALTSSVSIGQNTSNLDIAVAVSDSSEVTFSPAGLGSFTVSGGVPVTCSNSDGCVYDMAWTGLQFVITAQ